VGLYKKWCEATKEKDKRKRYWTYVEKDGGRDEIRDHLSETIRSHYDRLDRIAEDVERLGYKVAAAILREAMPQTPKGRSGDLGEILATELVEEEIGVRAYPCAVSAIRMATTWPCAATTSSAPDTTRPARSSGC
jgi:hypothetical protein